MSEKYDANTWPDQSDDVFIRIKFESISGLIGTYEMVRALDYEWFLNTTRRVIEWEFETKESVDRHFAERGEPARLSSPDQGRLL